MKFLKPKYIVFLFPCLLYFNTLWNGYSFDDNFVVQNETVKKGVQAIPEIFTGYYFQEDENTFGYRPVVRSLFAIEYSLFGENPAISHLINILLYALLCLVIFRFLSKLFPALKEEYLLIILLLFAAHPIHTEAVASLKNREEILAMLLGILALSFYVDFIDKKNYFLLIPVPFLIFLAVLTKENSVTYPVLIPIIYYIKNINNAGDIKKWLVPAMITAVVLIAAYLAYKLPEFILPKAEKIVFSFENPLHSNSTWLNRLFAAGISMWFYIKMLFVPYPLRYYYGFNMFPQDGINIILSILTFVFIIAVVLFAFIKIKKHSILSFFILFYVISIFVFSNYFIPVNGITGERMAFQASLGFCGAVVIFLQWISERKNDLLLKKRIMNIIYVVIALFSIMTFQRNRDWRSMESLLKADIGKLENSAKGQVVYASWNLGQIMQQKSEGKFIHPEAVNSILKHYKRSVEIFPGYYSSYNNMGTVFLHLKNRPDSALRYFLKAISIKPDYNEALYNCGVSFLSLNQNDSALKYFKKTLTADSSYTDTWLRLSELYIKLNDTSAAMAAAERALFCDSLSDKSLINMGNLYLIMRDTATAVSWWEKAISKNPQNPGLLYGLSKYFRQTGKKEKADMYDAIFQQYKK